MIERDLIDRLAEHKTLSAAPRRELEWLVAHGSLRKLNTDDVLEILSIPLLGIIPESEDVLRSSNIGTPVTMGNPTSAAARAYFEAARRLKGETLVVTVPAERRSLMGRLFGRRAVA